VLNFTNKKLHKMHIAGTIRDYDTHEPLSGVLLMLHGEDGNPTGLSAFTDFHGRYDWDEPQMFSIEKIKVSQVGYTPETFLVSDLVEGEVYLKAKNDFSAMEEKKEVIQETDMPQETLDIGRTITEEVTTEAKPTTATKEVFNIAPYILVGGLGIAAYLLFFKNKK
jgi:hypothetical protein